MQWEWTNHPRAVQPKHSYDNQNVVKVVKVTTWNNDCQLRLCSDNHLKIVVLCKKIPFRQCTAPIPTNVELMRPSSYAGNQHKHVWPQYPQHFMANTNIRLRLSTTVRSRTLPCRTTQTQKLRNLTILEAQISSLWNICNIFIKR